MEPGGGLYERTNFDGRPFVAVWEMTQARDLACVHCRACAQTFRHPWELTTEEKCLIDDDCRHGCAGFCAYRRRSAQATRRLRAGAVRDRHNLRISLTPSATPLLTRESIVRLYETTQRALVDIKGREAQPYRRYLLERRTEATRLGEAPSQTYQRLPQFIEFPVSAATDDIGRASRGINDGKSFDFISHLGEVYPSGFLPLSGRNIHRQSLAKVYRNSPLFRRLRNSKNLAAKC